MQSTNVHNSSCSSTSSSSDRRRRRRMRRTRRPTKTRNNNNDSTTERAKSLHQCRQFRETYEVHLWGSWRDVDDIFDLRYLYDDSEILEAKRQLVEDFDYYGNPRYFTYHDLDEYEEEMQQREQQDHDRLREQQFDFAILNENLELVFGENDELRFGAGVDDYLVAEQLQQQIDAAAAVEAEAADAEDEEEENWDNDEYNVRFDMRLGFITDDYDSGYDEPNSRKEEYPPLEDDVDVNDDVDEAQQRLADMLVGLHLGHVRPLAVNSS